MDVEYRNATDESLDPVDWAAMRALGHRMVDDMLSYLATVRERPVWQPIPDEVKARLEQPVPYDPEAPEDVYREFVDDVLPYPMGNIHPRFWWGVMGSGTPFAMLAEMLAAGMNPNCGAGEHAATYVEKQVIDWCKEILGYPAEASGLLVSGGTAANLVGLTVARNVKAGFDVRRQGLVAARGVLVAYASSQSHYSLQRAMEVLGLGSDALRLVPVQSDYAMDVGALTSAIATDRAAGRQPFCIMGTAGTTNTGAVDDLDALAEIAEREDLWFYVDGATGAFAVLASSLRPLVAGMERADSLTCDFHKWMHITFEAGCVLVKNAQAHRATFQLFPEYLAHGTRGVGGSSLWFDAFGLQGSRGFRALKVWMSIKQHGIAQYSRLMEQNVEHARYLAALVDAQPELERLAPVTLSIVCFRYRGQGLDEGPLNRLNQELVLRLQERGDVLPADTTLNGRHAVRVPIFNHRSRREDFDLLVQQVLEVGRELAREAVEADGTG